MTKKHVTQTKRVSLGWTIGIFAQTLVSATILRYTIRFFLGFVPERPLYLALLKLEVLNATSMIVISYLVALMVILAHYEYHHQVIGLRMGTFTISGIGYSMGLIWAVGFYLHLVLTNPTLNQLLHTNRGVVSLLIVGTICNIGAYLANTLTFATCYFGFFDEPPITISVPSITKRS